MIFVLRTDASSDGLNAVLPQEMDGGVLPVANHRKKLKQADKNYSTIERELLAVVDTVKKFYYYLYEDEFALQTDHMPLESRNNEVGFGSTAVSTESAIRVYPWLRKRRG